MSIILLRKNPLILIKFLVFLLNNKIFVGNKKIGLSQWVELVRVK